MEDNDTSDVIIQEEHVPAANEGQYRTEDLSVDDELEQHTTGDIIEPVDLAVDNERGQQATEDMQGNLSEDVIVQEDLSADNKNEQHTTGDVIEEDEDSSQKITAGDDEELVDDDEELIDDDEELIDDDEAIVAGHKSLIEVFLLANPVYILVFSRFVLSDEFLEVAGFLCLKIWGHKSFRDAGECLQF